MPTYTRFSHDERAKIEALYNAGISVCAIAKQLSRHHTSIYRELSHGWYDHLNSDYTYSRKYSAYKAEAYANFNRSTQGAQLKIGRDHAFARFVAKMIKQGYSPAAILMYIREHKLTFRTKVCTATLYSYIRKGLIYGVSTADLLRKPKRKKHQPRPRKQPTRGTSIEKRPAEVNLRQAFGHWEMDSVIGKRAKGKTMLVLTERKTRQELIFISPDKTASSTVQVLNALEQTLGPVFPSVFRSITCDNGTEFADVQGMERSPSGKMRTALYFCHAFASSERGSNENQNAFIRRFIPKGTPIERYTQEEITAIQDFINNYPRRLFNGKSSQQMFDAELANLGINKFL